MSRDEVVRAITRNYPKRIPVWYNFVSEEFISRNRDQILALEKEYPNDLLITSYAPPLERQRDPGQLQFSVGVLVIAESEGLGTDEWGVRIQHAEGGVGSRPINHPLQDWAQLDDYIATMPDANAPGRFEHVHRLVKENPDTYIMGHWWLGPFERMHILRGMENLFADLYFDRANVLKLGEALVDFYCEIIRNFANAGVDGIFFSDDWGTQNALMIDPNLWRQIFKPWYSRMIDEAHKYSLHAALHSCGHIEEIIPDLIDVGLDILHPVQPHANDIERVARDFGGKICFFGGIDVQQLMYGSPDQVRSEVIRVIDIFDRKEGGFMLAPANTIMPDTPIENVRALFETMYDYGLEHRGYKKVIN
ncbi:MAG: hypothetical protein HPY71_05835 [Firmicutes bacterium]|nr:hypothetical protein [Bacillota bacterium]